MYRYNGSGITTPYAFTFPSGVNEIAVEIWGGGGNGDEASAGSSYFTGGKSGAYIYAVIPVGTSTSMNLNVGSGSGCFSCGTTTNGNNSSVVLSGLLTLTAEGGSSNTFISLIARYSATGTYLPNVSYFGVEGSTGNWADIFYENSPSGYFVFHRNGKGADAPFRPNTGGKAGYMRTAYGTTSFTSIGGYPGSEPGGGGGFPTGSGGNGQVIVYW